jgi:hypothetical protein
MMTQSLKAKIIKISISIKKEWINKKVKESKSTIT